MMVHSADIDSAEIVVTAALGIHPLRAGILGAQRSKDPAWPWKHVAVVITAMILAASESAR